MSEFMPLFIRLQQSTEDSVEEIRETGQDIHGIIFSNPRPDNGTFRISPLPSLVAHAAASLMVVTGIASPAWQLPLLVRSRDV